MITLTKLAAAVTLSAIVLCSLFPSVANAQTAEQNQTVEVICSSSSNAYGQSTAYCNAKAKQRQRVLGVTKNSKPCETVVQGNNKYHKPCEAGIDTFTLSGIIAAAATSAGAGLLIIKRK